MIDPALLTEIEKLLADARGGYAHATNAEYVRHVGALLAERAHLEELVGIAKLNGLLLDLQKQRPAMATEEPA